jgi:hypothetical protein
MSGTIKDFAEVALGIGENVLVKKSFLLALGSAVDAKPTLADAGLVKVLANSAAMDRCTGRGKCAHPRCGR